MDTDWTDGHRRADPASRAWAMVSLVLVVSVCQGARAAPGAPEPSAAVRLRQKWERVLLLDDVGYLRLAPGHLRELQALARLAADRLAPLQREEAQLRVRLGPLVDRNRAAL